MIHLPGWVGAGFTIESSMTRLLRLPRISIVLLLLVIFATAIALQPDTALAWIQGAGNVADGEANSRSGINLFRLLLLGGWFMVPLLSLSLFAAGICIERTIALRRDRILPERLVERLARLGQQAGGLDPRDAYVVCQSTPSIASDILKSVLVKVGRPHMELEHACTESAQRSAIGLQQTVSWLNVCAAIAPLIGLLGTVWGITQAFYDTTQLEVGQNRADALSHGIYIALVTTIVGLTIAIPATIASHYFENRIVSLLNRVEEMVRGLLPQLERFEGALRFSHDDIPEAGSFDLSAPSADDKDKRDRQPEGPNGENGKHDELLPSPARTSSTNKTKR